MTRQGGAALFINTHARRGAKLFDRAASLLTAAGVELGMTVAVTDPDSLPQRVEAAIANGYDRILIGGGDGTLSSAIGAFANRPVVLGVLPLGTGNQLAHTLGVGRLEEAVRAIAANHIVDIDLSRANDRYFINTLSIGLSDEVAAAANRRLKRALGVVAYAVAGIRVFLTHRRFRARVAASGQEIETDTHQLVVANGTYIGPRVQAGPDASIDNRQLVVFSMGGYSRWRLLRHTLKVALGRHVRDPEIHYFVTDELTITTEPAQTVTLDGEPHGSTPVTIRVAPEALNVFASPDFVDDVGMQPATPSRVFTQFARGFVHYRK